MEDDLRKEPVENITRKINESGSNPLIQETPGTILIPSKTVSDPGHEDRSTPYLPDRQEDKDISFCKKDEMAHNSQSRVRNSTDSRILGDQLEDDKFVDNTPHCITVNGRRLSYPRSIGKMNVKKIGQEDKRNTPKRRKKTLETQPSSGQIWKYLTVTKKKDSDQEYRKIQEDNTPGMEDKNTEREEGKNKKKDLHEKGVETKEFNKGKTTFKPMNTVKVKENIKMFQKLSMGENCVIGSGRCSRHNVKLVRGVVMKKVSCIDKNGKLSWLMREVTNLSCPYKPDRQHGSDESAMMSPVTQSRGTNGSVKKLRYEVEDQSQVDAKISGVEQDIPLASPIEQPTLTGD